MQKNRNLQFWIWVLSFEFASLQLLKSLTFKQGAADFLKDRHEWHLRYVISTANILWCKWPCGMFVESTLHMQAE